MANGFVAVARPAIPAMSPVVPDISPGLVTGTDVDGVITPRSVATRLQHLVTHTSGQVNVRYYGADPTGVADSGPAFLAAIAALPATGGKVYVPAGTYNIATSIATSKAGIVIEGEGGGGWSVGSASRLVTAAAIIVLDFGTSTGEERGAQIRNLSIQGSAASIGAIHVLNQRHGVFHNVVVNNFTTGYAFGIEGSSYVIEWSGDTGGRQNKYGIQCIGDPTNVAAFHVGGGVYFAEGSPAIANAVGVQMADGKFFGRIDAYDEGVQLLGDSAQVNGRFESNTTHIHIVGHLSGGTMFARRNIVAGSMFVNGTTGILVDSSTGIFGNVLGPNTYANVTTNVTDNSASTLVRSTFEPQIGTIDLRYGQVGVGNLFNLTDTRGVASGEGAWYKAKGAAGSGAIVKMGAEANIARVGTESSTNLEIIRGGNAQITLTAAGPADRTGAILRGFPVYTSPNGTQYRLAVANGGGLSAASGPAQNLLRYSEQAQQGAAWTYGTAVSISADSTTAPDTTATADSFVVGPTGTATLLQQFTAVSGTTYTAAWHLKKSNWDWYRFMLYDGGGNQIRIWVNLATGAIGTMQGVGTGVLLGAATTSLGSGWYRFSLAGTVAWTVTNFQLSPQVADGDATAANNATAYVWGAQVNTGDLVSAYLVTAAAAIP